MTRFKTALTLLPLALLFQNCGLNFSQSKVANVDGVNGVTGSGTDVTRIELKISGGGMLQLPFGISAASSKFVLALDASGHSATGTLNYGSCNISAPIDYDSYKSMSDQVQNAKKGFNDFFVADAPMEDVTVETANGVSNSYTFNQHGQAIQDSGETLNALIALRFRLEALCTPGQVISVFYNRRDDNGDSINIWYTYQNDFTVNASATIWNSSGCETDFSEKVNAGAMSAANLILLSYSPLTCAIQVQGRGSRQMTLLYNDGRYATGFADCTKPDRFVNTNAFLSVAQTWLSPKTKCFDKPL